MKGTILNWVLSGTSLLTALGWFRSYRSAKKVENLTANEKDITVTDTSLVTLKNVSEQLGDAHILMGVMRKDIAKQDLIIHNFRNTIFKLKKIVDTQIGLKEFAEANICLVKDCELRTPPNGIYKSSSNKRLLDAIQKELEEDGECDNDSNNKKGD